MAGSIHYRTLHHPHITPIKSAAPRVTNRRRYAAPCVTSLLLLLLCIYVTAADKHIRLLYSSCGLKGIIISRAGDESRETMIH